MPAAQRALPTTSPGLRLKSETVGQAYTNLVQQVRITAGAAMQEAWKAPPVTMNITPSVIDLVAYGRGGVAGVDTERRAIPSSRLTSGEGFESVPVRCTTFDQQ